MSDMAYAFRFKADVGDIVYAVTLTDETGKVNVDVATIKEIQDNSYHTLQDATGFTNELVRADDFENYSIGYWVKEDNLCIGVAMYFGESLFLTQEEALMEAHRIEELQKEDLI